jgi:hypothetical protein
MQATESHRTGAIGERRPARKTRPTVRAMNAAMSAEERVPTSPESR